MPRGRARLALGFAISAVLLLLLARAVDLADLRRAIATADLRLLPVAVGFYFAGVWTRSVRWCLLLPRGSVRAPTAFRALLVGFTANNLLPVRMGELARAYLMARWRAVPYGDTLASLVVERVLDGLTLAALLLVALALVPAPGYLLGLGLLVGGAFSAGAGILGLAAWKPRAVAGVAAALARPLPPPARHAVERLALGFGRGLAIVRGWRLLARLLGLSILAWLLELGLFYVLMLGFAFPRSPALALLAGSAANFATLMPSSPGYVGTFDAALAKVLVDTARVPTGDAVAYALLVHAALFFPVIVVGLLVLWRANLSMVDLVHAGERPPTHASAAQDSGERPADAAPPQLVVSGRRVD